MALSLFIAMYLNLDRPYWAMISAVFLQFRPQSGLVIQKAIFQIAGTFIGGIVGIFILDLLINYSIMAIVVTGLWIGFCSTMSTLVRNTTNTNYIYFFAMAGITATIVVLLVMARWPDITSQSVFSIAQARVSEIVIGAGCAAVMSMLFWPSRISDHLKAQAKVAANHTLNYLSVELSDEASHEARHQSIDVIMQTLSELSDDSSGAVFEGPTGKGHARAIKHFCNKTLSLIAGIQIFGRLKREHPELLTDAISKLIEQLQANFYDIRQSEDFEYCYRLAQQQRRMIAQYRLSTAASSALEARLLKFALEFSSDLIMMLKTYRAIERPDNTLLKAHSLKPHTDPMDALTRGLRSALIFWIGSVFWLATGAMATVMVMLLPVVFSIMLARLPQMLLKVVLRRMLWGIVVAVLVSIFYVLALLIQGGAYFEILILIFGGPLFLGLYCLTNRPTMPFGIGFTITYIVLVRPAMDMSMSFDIAYTTSAGMGIFVGVLFLSWLFRLIPGPSPLSIQRRLVKATCSDLEEIFEHDDPEAWFNLHMGNRLLHLANMDQHSKKRALTDLGLTALNLGHTSIRLTRYINSLSGNLLRAQLAVWQSALANAIYQCSQGQINDEFEQASRNLLNALVAIQGENNQTELIKGACERIQLTFNRSAKLFAEESD